MRDINILNPRSFNKSLVNFNIKSFTKRKPIRSIDMKKVSPEKPKQYQSYKGIIKETKQSVTYLKEQIENLNSDNEVEFDVKGFKKVIKDKSKKEITDNTVQFGEKLTSNTIINTDIHTSKLANIFSTSMRHITNIQNKSISIITHKVDYLMRFQDGVEATFYDDMISHMTSINVKLESAIDTASVIGENKKRMVEGKIMMDRTYAEQLFLKNNVFQKVLDSVLKIQNMNMDDPIMMMVKSTIDTAISSPLKIIISGIINAIMPTQFKDTIKKIEGVAKNFNISLALSINDAKYSKNPIISVMANRLIPDEDSSSNTKRKYKKKALTFDGITRRAIVRTIPTLLSYILTAYDPHRYPSPLVYDYDKGVFNTEKNVKKYVNGLLDKEKKRVTNLREARAYNENMIDIHQAHVRFSNSEDKFDKKFGSIMNEKKDRSKTDKFKDAARDTELGNRLNETRERARDIRKRFKIFDKFFQNEDGTPREGILTKINNLTERLNFIITGKLDFEKAVDKVLENTFKLGEKAVVIGGKIKDSKIMETIRNHIMVPIRDFFKSAIRKGRSMIDEYILQPVKEVSMDLIISLIGKPKDGQSILDRAFRVATVKWRKSVVRPITNTIIKMRNVIKSKFIEILKPLVEYLKEATRKMQNTNAYRIIHESVEESDRQNINEQSDSNNENDSSNANPHRDDIIEEDNPNNNRDNKKRRKKFRKINHIITIINTLKDNILLAAKHMEIVERNITKIKPSLKEKFKNTYNNDKSIYSVDDRLYDYMLINNMRPRKFDPDRKRDGGGLNLIQKIIIGSIRNVIKFRNYITSDQFLKDIDKFFVRAKTFAASTASNVLYIADKAIRIGGTALKLYTDYVMIGIKKSVFMMAKKLQLKTYVVFALGKVAPPIVKTVGKCMEKLIHLTGNLAKRASKFALKTAGGITTLALHLINGGTMLVTGLLNKLFNRKADKNNIKAYIIGGISERFNEQTEVRYVSSPITTEDKFRQEDIKDARNRKNTKSTADSARKRISERIKEKLKAVNKLFSKVVDKILDGASYILSGGIGLLLGGSFGEKLKNLVINNKEKSNNGVMKVYITGGSVENTNSGGSVIDKVTDTAEDILGDNTNNVIEDIVDNGSTKKSSKLKNLAKKLLGKKGGKKKLAIVAGVGAALAGSAAIVSHANSDNNENMQESFDENKDEVKALFNFSNKVKAHTENEKELAKKESETDAKLRAVMDSVSAGIIKVKTSEVSSVNKHMNEAATKAQSKVALLEENRRTELGVESKLGETDNLDTLNAEDMVKIYRKSVNEDKLSENLVFNKLNYNEKLKYADQRILGNSFNEVYDQKKLKENITKKKTLGDIIKGFVSGIVGIPLVGFAISVFKKAWEGIKNTWGKVKEGATNIFESIKGGIKSLIDKVKGWFTGNNGNNGNNGDNSNGNYGGTVGPGSIGANLVKYGMMFNPQKLTYSQGSRHTINFQGKGADCTSYTGHVYKVITGSQVCGGTDRYPSRTADWYSYYKKNKDSNPNMFIRDKSKLQPGDAILYIPNGQSHGHAALYVGDGKVLTHGGPEPGPTVKDIDYRISYRHYDDFITGIRWVDTSAHHDGTLHDPNTAVTGLSGSTLPSDSSTTTNNTNQTSTASLSGNGIGCGCDDEMPSTVGLLSSIGKPIEQSKQSSSSTVNNATISSINNITSEDTNKAYRQNQVRNQITNGETEQALVKKSIMNNLVTILNKYEEVTNKMTNKENIVYINKVRQILELAQQEDINASDIEKISREVALIAGGY